MSNQGFRNQLKDIYKGLHGYTKLLLTDLDEKNYNWRPAETKARTIYSYFRHMVNTEIYWLHALKTHKIPYFSKNLNLMELLDHFEHLEVIYTKLIMDSENKEFEIKSTTYVTNDDTGEISSIKQKGTVAWTVFRISLHTFGHMSQISHMMYSQGLRPAKHPEYNWWNITENIIDLGKLVD